MQNKSILIKNWFDKAEQALSAAQDNINLNNLETAQNRIYYGIFYAVSSLSKSKDFVTSKHQQLLGWFNREFVKPGIIKKETAQIYSDAFEFRQKADYTINFIPEKDKTEEMLEEAKNFIEEIKKLLEL